MGLSDGEKDNIVALLHETILGLSDEIRHLQKYGGTLYTERPNEKEGQFCGVFVFANHVHLAFAQGAQLPDPDQILQGKGKYRRHINFEAIDDLDQKQVEDYLRVALELCRDSGP